MSAVELFTYAGGYQVRVIRDDDGDPWFVLADLCRVLDIRNARDVAARLADDQKGVDQVDTPGGRQQMTLVSEAGMYEVVIRSDKSEAVSFRRWVTGEVLPAIRKTGTYSRYPAGPAALPSKKELAQWVIDAEERAERAEAKVAELTPPAAAWNELAESAGDYSVADAAKVLSRDPQIETGERRLYAFMAAIGWVFKVKGRWRAYQSQVEIGRLSEKVGKPFWHEGRGEMVLPDPTVRITPKGVAELHKRLGGTGQLALVSAL
ncbi:phage antirepressor [Mycobacterium avium]|uniref:Gp54 protein n=1 Tax=Mycobacterium avium (strain 104) TaxID=243243 RepID=A0A0H3A2I2_MYCA1|nr:phage antirepressor KilAC domain-containing protein [Mycobacterium avium]ABK68775.1 gp54 protein [Mycobacterium avium 104]KDP08333.1 hypothetical protein MAV101_04265 [Mycobacterium avium subsp. hominissuis 101]MCG3242491.1 phage antirepressor KilAC domain-containing protein [Mycobacterium avium subsp. hominissuis]MDV3219394.1 phage antirepressor KilAC domain-containing protein [Mycobacterium avium]WOF19866.1 phage antirepressor KilAC domain-containing protein [Mycobacterium avium]